MYETLCNSNRLISPKGWRNIHTHLETHTHHQSSSAIRQCQDVNTFWEPWKLKTWSENPSSCPITLFTSSTCHIAILHISTFVTPIPFCSLTPSPVTLQYHHKSQPLSHLSHFVLLHLHLSHCNITNLNLCHTYPILFSYTFTCHITISSQISTFVTPIPFCSLTPSPVTLQYHYTTPQPLSHLSHFVLLHLHLSHYNIITPHFNPFSPIPMCYHTVTPPSTTLQYHHTTSQLLLHLLSYIIHNPNVFDISFRDTTFRIGLQVKTTL